MNNSTEECLFVLTDRGSKNLIFEHSGGPEDINSEQSTVIAGLIETEARKNSGVVKRESGQKGHYTTDRLDRTRRGLPHVSKHFYGGGFIEHWEHIQTAFATTAAAGAFLGAAKGWLLQWLKNKGNRSVKFKKGDLEIQVHGTDDIARILKTIEPVVETITKPQSKKAVTTPRNKARSKPKAKSKRRGAAKY